VKGVLAYGRHPAAVAVVPDERAGLGLEAADA
jgi:hypothetical protein